MPKQQLYTYSTKLAGDVMTYIGDDPSSAARYFFERHASDLFGERGDVRDLSHDGHIDDRTIRYSAFVGRYIGRGATEGRTVRIVVECGPRIKEPAKKKSRIPWADITPGWCSTGE